MRCGNALHLGYCTNVHPAEGWDEVLENLRRYTVPLKAAIAPSAPFGLGLRLSDLDSRELLEGSRLTRFKAFLEAEGLYVYTLNGFPFGAFHGERVKSAVFEPDWREDARADYTLRLAHILAYLLPDGLDGGISTVPLSYRAWVAPDDEAAWEAIVARLVRVCAALARLHRIQGKLIHVDLEPEPGGLLECSRDVVAFFHERLLPVGGRWLAEQLSVSEDEARGLLVRHVRVCYDTCHAAVIGESAGDALARLADAGIQVGKLQLSSALRIVFEPDEAHEHRLAQLAPFAESTYLHQVVETRRDGTTRCFEDLAPALAEGPGAEASEWRVHFHVPIFLERFGDLLSTQPHLIEALAQLEATAFTQHLEVETYTWEVLPEGLKDDLLPMLERELAWALAAVGRGAPVAVQEAR